MRKILIVSLFLFLFTNGFSQTNEKGQEVDMVIHNVQLGETVRLISQKYLVAPSEIYKYNKFATDGITEGMTLYLPVPKKEIVNVEKGEPQEAEPSQKPLVVKEVAVVTEQASEDKKEQSPTEKVAVVVTEKSEVISPEKNTEITTDKKEQITTASNYPVVSAAKVQSVDIVSSADPNTVIHKVQKQETLYGLSKVYNITVEELKEQNKTVLKNGLQIGQILTIKKNN